LTDILAKVFNFVINKSNKMTKNILRDCVGGCVVGGLVVGGLVTGLSSVEV